MPSLIVRDVKNGRVKEIELTKRRFTIGKSDWNDLVLPRDSVSREHCVVFERGDSYFVRDLESRHGTLIGAKRIEGDVPLADGDRFELGGFEVLFREARQRVSREELAPASSVERSGHGRSGQRPGAGKAAGRPPDAWRALKQHCHAELLDSKELKRVDFDTIEEDAARQMTERVLVRIIKDLEDKGRLVGQDRACGHADP